MHTPEVPETLRPHPLRAGLARALDLPPELILDLPRLLWVAGDSLTVENHRGILEYRPDLVRLRVPGGELIVEGARLRIGRLAGSEITLRGDLRSARLERKP